MVKTETAIKEIVQEYVSRLNRTITVDKVLLFGSYADGEALSTSDIDLVVISEDFANIVFHERLVFLLKHWHAHIGADILGYTSEEFDRFSQGITLIAEIKNKGKIIWG